VFACGSISIGHLFGMTGTHLVGTIARVSVEPLSPAVHRFGH
jgi:hypothetical protein